MGVTIGAFTVTERRIHGRLDKGVSFPMGVSDRASKSEYDDVILDAVTAEPESCALQLLDDALSRGERVSGQDRPALYYAALSGHVRVVARLIDAGATLAAECTIDDAEDFDSALHWAAAVGDIEIVKLLLKVDARDFLNIVNHLNRTPLMAAVFDGHVDVAQTLLEAGSDPNARTDCGETALDYAVAHERTHLVRLLIGAGADPNVRTWMNMSAADRAKTPEMRELLGDAARRTH